MENRGLLFIPDISGFTRFVSSLELDHSKQIIQELLEVLIHSNQIGLQISEIEGDAILFYKFGNSPDVRTLFNQVEQMFLSFHNHINSYECRRYCHCDACNKSIDLTLKVITHYGEFTNYQVQQFKKLIGKDVIVAHQLLKNDIPQSEYWLITKNLAEIPPNHLAEWIMWNNSVKQTETGDIAFYYTPLSNLLAGIAPVPPTILDVTGKVRVFTMTNEFESDIIKLFHASGDFSHRASWLEGVEQVELMDHYLPRVGMRCRYVVKNGKEEIYSSSYSFSPDKIEFGETEARTNNIMNYILENQTNGKVRLTIEYYIKDNPLDRTIYALTKKNKMMKKYEKSFARLEDFLKVVKMAGYDTPEHNH